MISSLIAQYLYPAIGAIVAFLLAVIGVQRFKIKRNESNNIKREADAVKKQWADSVELDKELAKVAEATKTAVKAAKTAAFPNGIDLE